MTDTLAPPRLTRLTFHGPLSEARASRLVGRLARTAPATVLDIGCGWGELMLRVLAAVPAATGTGIDLNEDDLARGRANATSRGLAQRAEFVAGSATGTTAKPADLVLCLGASHALSDKEPPGHIPEALRFLRRLVTPGGRVLLGEGFWERPPAAAELAGLVDLAVAAGFRPEWIEPASLAEWDDFESGYLADVEEWLATHDDPQVRARADEHRSCWLRGYRAVMGLAYLTLVPVQAI
jgi:cyclopropane fatty-acyl-phospholipid synthase-like methyltransferase